MEGSPDLKQHGAPSGSATTSDIPQKDGMYFAHNAFRRDFDMVVKALAALDPAQAWQCKNLAKWWKVEVSNIHEHHDIEEEIFFPWITSKALVPPKMSADHKTLMSKMDELTREIEGLAAGATVEERTACLATVRTLWPAFDAIFREHIGEEDVVVPPLLHANFTLKEYKAIEKKIIAKAIPTADTTIPRMLCVMGEAERADFIKQLPPPPRFLLRKKWWPRYKARIEPLITSIYDATVTSPHLKPAHSGLWWCGAAYQPGEKHVL